MEQHYQTEKRTFVVIQGVCIRVMTSEGNIEESHAALNCSLLGGVNEIFRTEMNNPPLVGQHLAFQLKLSAGSGRNKLFSDTKIRRISEHKEMVIILTKQQNSRQSRPGV